MKLFLINICLFFISSLGFSQIYEIGGFVGGSNFIGDVGNTTFINPNQKINIRKGIGITLGLIGASTLILNGGDVSGNTNFMLGNMFVFINAASYGLYLVLVKPLMQKYYPITVMFYVFGFGLLYVLPFGYTELKAVDWLSFPPIIIWEVLFVVVCTTVIAYLLNSSALKLLNPSTVSIYIYLQPVLATIIAVSIGKDSLTLPKVLFSLLIFIGVYLVGLPNDAKSKI